MPQWHPLQTHHQAVYPIQAGNVRVRQTQTFRLNHRLPEKLLALTVLERLCPDVCTCGLEIVELGEAELLIWVQGAHAWALS